MSRYIILTLSIFLLSFFVESSSGTSQNTIADINEIVYYSEFEMQLTYLNECTKLMYADILRMSLDLQLHEAMEVKSNSWEDIKSSIHINNEPDTTKKN